MKHLYLLIVSFLLAGALSAQSPVVGLTEGTMQNEDKIVFTVHRKTNGVILNTSNCENRPINFSVSRTRETVQNYAWDFGTGETSDLSNPIYTYTVAGDYIVTLVLTYTDGSKETITKQLRIGKVPVPDFTASTVEGNYPFTVQFINTTNGNVLTYLWNFGNYVTSNLIDPTHMYANATKDYTVTLTAVSPEGCEASVTKQGYIHVIGQPVYTLFVPNSFSPNGDGLNESFIAYGENIRNIKMDIFNASGTLVYSQSGLDPLTKGWNGENLSNTPLPSGLYTYKIIATDNFGVDHESMGNVNLMR